MMSRTWSIWHWTLPTPCSFTSSMTWTPSPVTCATCASASQKSSFLRGSCERCIKAFRPFKCYTWSVCYHSLTCYVIFYIMCFLNNVFSLTGTQLTLSSISLPTRNVRARWRGGRRNLWGHQHRQDKSAHPQSQGQSIERPLSHARWTDMT